MPAKLTRNNLQTAVRALTGLERSCWSAESDLSSRVRDRTYARGQASAYRMALDLIEETTGVTFELYGDEIDIALFEAEQDGVIINL